MERGQVRTEWESLALDATSWRKSQTAVLSTDDSISMYGPSHNSFTVSEDEEETLFVFHARTYKNIIGDRCTFQIAYIRDSAFVDG